jgi:zinc protease
VKFTALLLLLTVPALPQMRVVQLPSKSPLVTFRIVFTVGSEADPDGKPGLAALTAHMLADSGTRDLTYKQVEDELFPMAATLNVQVDKEMTTFFGSTHVDNLAEYY